MPVDKIHHQALLQRLNLGLFPRNLLEFRKSSVFIHQIIYVDHRLHLTLQLISAQTLFNTKSDEDSQTIIKELIDHVGSINVMTQKSYLEVYYASVVLAHLQVLSLDFESAIATLSNFTINHAVILESKAEREFLDYISARFHALLSKASANGSAVRSIFLESLKRYGHTSQVAANTWIDCILDGFISDLTSNGKKLIQFSDLRQLKFTKNICSFVSVANCILGQENETHKSSSFESDYVKFLSELLNEKINQRKDFPDASDEKSDELNFVETLYHTLNNISNHGFAARRFITAELSKKFLLSMTENSYQSQPVLLNLISTLIDLGEYDEAYAAFKTYVSYVKRESVQTGSSTDLLQTIRTYSLCILLFNPLNSFIQDAKSTSKRFRYNSLDTVAHNLSLFAEDLQDYMTQLAVDADLTYEESFNVTQNQLAFLYRKYNPHILSDSRSSVIRSLSDAWYSLGKLQQYFCTHDSANLKMLENNKTKLLMFYKNALIVNPLGSLTYMLDYALALAYENYVSESAKLCKFILRKSPESFKTWNLLALLASALENKHSINDKKPSDFLLEDKHNDYQQNGDSDVVLQNDKDGKLHNAEMFIEHALNIASLFITNHRDAGVAISLQKKYDILQLKMTQLAIREAKSGVESILEYISDIFVLYRELFLGGSNCRKELQSGMGARADTKWSRRPSVMDPNEANGIRKNLSALNRLNKETIKRFSKLSMDSRGKNDTIDHKQKESSPEQIQELRILQELWLWAASIYLKLGFLEEAEQCIVEAETADKPNVRTHTYLGLLTSQHRKRLSLQEFERSFEVLHSAEEKFNRKSYGLTLAGMSQLLITNDSDEASLFVSEKDRDAGLVRVKNYLENFRNCWPYGHNNPEVWFFLSSIYEEFDDKLLQAEALWRCIDLESIRPVRSYDVCEDFAI
ncbi:hypothetical protein METBIDRAFT_33550 [Metschnikowia bicuspidata var. bicuspidata NRRL YB-4993]|uniref:Cargo-transport protein YPP1 n=1 Tax=Metschnikowia bicuspidata var. bicuspidata NRRL YB-4993 TaxID=869754 RepID=A0A1A0H648_9ASCO|nr:hypothetical protein METBIDRAFT_33550 [Metschnikowia bicuspidata var. bicuspidata NRRL YB-4993]OBA19382.1 hypothetical protein METBIDRAFT_33550 [Metschnikowia bicuspidata var. bicuspidata NRRL YB-4993]